MEYYYAVKRGRKPGIYLTWDECKEQIVHFPYAKYRKFETKEEAEAFLNSKDDPPKKLKITTPNYAFVDGSYNPTTKRYGYGVVIVLNDIQTEENVPLCAHLNGSGSDSEMAAMRNVAGEILGCEKAVSFALEKDVKNITIIHDYTGIERWATGDWKRNKKSTKDYHKFIKKAKKKIDIYFLKVRGHSGVEGNEIADQLAKSAVGLINKDQIKESTELKSTITETIK